MYLELKDSYTSSFRHKSYLVEIPILRYNSQVYLLSEVFHQGKIGMHDSKELISISRIVAVSECVCLIPLALFEVEFKVLV